MVHIDGGPESLNLPVAGNLDGRGSLVRIRQHILHGIVIAKIPDSVQ